MLTTTPSPLGSYNDAASFGYKALCVLGALLVGAIFAKVVSTANNYLFG